MAVLYKIYGMGGLLAIDELNLILLGDIDGTYFTN